MKTYKGYIVKAAPQTPQHVVISTEGRGGKIPACLSGMFTSYATAYREIDQYEELKTKKE